MKSLFFTMFGLLIFITPANGQNSSERINYNLLFYPTIRASAMGEAGVGLVEENNYSFNPALLGLLSMDNKVSASGFLSDDYYMGLLFYNSYLRFPVKISDKFNLGVAYHYSKFGAELEEMTLDSPDGTGQVEFVGNKIHNFTVGLGYTGRLKLALGITTKFINEKLFDIEGNTVAFDFGFALSFPSQLEINGNSGHIFYINPVFGCSRNYIGSDLEYDTGIIDNGTRPVPINNSYSLPSLTRIGYSFEFGWIKKTDYYNWKIISVLPSLEEEKIKRLDLFNNYGIEFGIAEMVYIRLGKNDYTDFSTKGFELSLNGAVKSIASLTGNYKFYDEAFLSRVDIRYTYAVQKPEEDFVFQSNKHSKELTVSYQLYR